MRQSIIEIFGLTNWKKGAFSTLFLYSFRFLKLVLSNPLGLGPSTQPVYQTFLVPFDKRGKINLFYSTNLDEFSDVNSSQ